MSVLGKSKDVGVTEAAYLVVMDLRQLAYFVAVVEEGSITAAAERLHMTQPPLSAAVTRLEKGLGVRLLERHARGVRPTEAGVQLVRVARRLLMDVDRLGHEMRALGAGMAGELRVGAEPIGMWNFVGEKVSTFATEVPDVRVDVIDTPPGRLVELVGTGEVDVAVVPTAEPERLAADLATTLHTTVLGSLPLRLVRPGSWADLGEEPVRPAALMDRPWILPRRIPGMRILPEAVDEVFARAGRRPGRIIEVSTPHTALPLVASGLGYSVATPGVIEHVPTLSTVALDGGIPPLTLMALWRRDAVLSPPSERFISHIREHSDGVVYAQGMGDQRDR